jgi:hypothetical protein
VIGILSGGESGDGGASEAGGSQSERPPTYREQVLDSIDGDNPRFECIAGVCTARFKVDVLGLFNTQDELMEEVRDPFAAMFEGKQAKMAIVVLEGDVESIGGKSSVAPILRVTCTREANREIDWENVDNEGLEALCEWDELVNFD